jgi:type VI protein secretion system component VasK
MTKEKITKILNQVFVAAAILLVVGFIVSSINSNDKKVNFMEKYDAKADSLFRMQTEYKKLLQESNQRIKQDKDTLIIIEKTQKEFHEKSISYTIGLRADSTIWPELHSAINKWDSLYKLTITSNLGRGIGL